MRNNSQKIKIIQSPITPSKYINNFLKNHNSTLEEYYEQKEVAPSPTLKYNNINKEYYQMQTYQKNNNESVGDLKSFHYFNINDDTNYRDKGTTNEHVKYSFNNSYYESKYSKKKSNQSNNISSNNINTTYTIPNSNTHKVRPFSNEKIKIYNQYINNSLIQSINRSHILSPNSFSKSENIVNEITPTKKPSEMFYSKDMKNKVIYQQKAYNNNKKNPSLIIYREPYNNNVNITKKIIQPKTPSLNSHYKIDNTEKNYLLSNNTMIKQNFDNESKYDKNLHNKSLETISFKNKIIDLNNMKTSNINAINVNNRRNINLKQNNFKKVVKITNQNVNKTNSKDNIVEPFRLSEVNKNNNSSINNTIVNITYINENKNYIKNVYSNDILKPQSQDKFILDNEKPKIQVTKKDYKTISNDIRKTPNQRIKVIKANGMNIYTPMTGKIRDVNNETNSEKHIKIFKYPQNKERINANKDDNDYMQEIKNIMYNKSNNSKLISNNNRSFKDTKILISKNKIIQHDNHSLMNDINTTQKQKNEQSLSNLSINIKKIKEKSIDRDYELIYNAKVIQSKYSQKTDNTHLSNSDQNKFNNISNTYTINTDKSHISKISSKFNGTKSNKSFTDSINKVNIQNNISSKIIKNINNTSIKQINSPPNISKLTITNISSKKPKIKLIKNKKEEALENKTNKKNINPFKYGEKTEIKKRTLDIIKNNVKKEKDKEEKDKEKTIVYINKIEGITLAGKNERGIKKINQDTYFIEKNVNGVDNFNIFGVLDGHGDNGHLASKFVQNFMINQLKNHPLIKNEKDPKKIYSNISSNFYQILANIYLDADIEIQKQDFDCSRSGTTCIIIIQLLDHIICTNTGDSRAMVVFDDDDNLFKSKVYPLSYDCKPELPKEKQRIIESGGVVEKAYYSDDEEGENSGPYRVWAKGEDFPGLAMSRSIGDMDAKKVGVIPNPQIVEYNIDKLSKYFVMASDGIWEFISNEECMQICNPYFLKDDCKGLLRELSRRASELWSTNDIIRDDITVLVGFF